LWDEASMKRAARAASRSLHPAGRYNGAVDVIRPQLDSRRRLTVVAALVIALPLVVRSQSPVERPAASRIFDDDRVGAAPAGMLFAQVKGTAPGRWVVQRTAPDVFLAHLGDTAHAAGGVALALIDGPQVEHEDVRVSTRFRVTGGSRVAGVVWRYQDPDTFYMASLDLARQRLEVHRLGQGNRVRIRSKEGLALDPLAWHTLAVVHEEHEIRLYLGGIHVFEFWDRTLRRAGRAGVWSAADTDAHFDEVRVEPEVDEHEAPRRRGRE
jgi:hypothetical protein